MKPPQMLAALGLGLGAYALVYPAHATSYLLLRQTPPPSCSADGSSITPNGGGSLSTNAGVWTFGADTASSGNVALLNGAQPIAGQGYGTLLEVNHGCVLYHQNNQGAWWYWAPGSWVAGAP